MSNDKSDLKTLAKELSDSYTAILQYSSLKDEQIAEHLSRLAKYSNHLPLTWFTPAFVESLLAVRRRDDSQETTSAIHSLWTAWLRRLSGAPDAIPNVEPQLLKVLTEQRNVILNPSTSISVRKDAWIGLLALTGCGPAKFSDIELANTMNQAMEEYTKIPELMYEMNDTIDACVAHFLAQTTLLNAFEVQHCETLLDAYLRMKTGYTQAVPSIMTVMEHVVDIRSKQQPASRADSVLETTVKLAQALVTDSLQPENIAVLAGIVRMLQFVQVKSKRIRSLRKQIEPLFVTKLNELVYHGLFSQHASLMVTLQDAIAYMAGQCLPSLPADVLDIVHAHGFLRVLVSCLLTSQQIWGGTQMFHSLNNTAECKQKLEKLLNSPLHKEIGRVSRALSAVIRRALEAKHDHEFVTTLQASLDRFVGYSYNICIDWDRFHRDNNEILMSQDLKKQFKEINDAAWSVLKSMLFAYTAIFKAIAVDLVNGKGLMEVEYAAQDIVSCFANFHFITDRLGSGSGFTAYQETLTNAVAYLLHDENTCQLNQMLSKVYREYAPPRYTDDSTPPVLLLSPIQQLRLLFYTNLVEQVIGQLDDHVLEVYILPAIYPILRWKKNENKDLYESAHAAVLAIFSSQKLVSRELAGIYATILLESFPEPMTLQQLRFAYTTMIQSICQVDDALAWLATEFLLDKIRSRPSDDIQVPQYLTVLIDLIKPLSLGPFLGQLLSNIENLILQQPTSAMRTASLKIVFETVSGSAVSDIRRVEAVGWFLNLKQKVETECTSSVSASA